MRRIPTSLLCSLVAAGALSGCSKAAAHTTMQNMARQQCQEIINPDERRECEARHSESYREYRAKTYDEDVSQ
jgi:hypothetical protein